MILLDTNLRFTFPKGAGGDMTLEGRIENGVVVFNEPVALPDGTVVRVEVVAATPAQDHKAEQAGHFLKHYKNLIGTVDDLPADAALNHDHYLYGLPKK